MVIVYLAAPDTVTGGGAGFLFWLFRDYRSTLTTATGAATPIVVGTGEVGSAAIKGYLDITQTVNHGVNQAFLIPALTVITAD
jgi:hypothetical protein